MDETQLVVQARNAAEAWKELDPQNRTGNWTLVSADYGYYLFVNNATQADVERYQDGD